MSYLGSDLSQDQCEAGQPSCEDLSAKIQRVVKLVPSAEELSLSIENSRKRIYELENSVREIRCATKCGHSHIVPDGNQTLKDVVYAIADFLGLKIEPQFGCKAIKSPPARTRKVKVKVDKP